MRKTILIPTDFTVIPLLALKEYVNTSQHELDVVFFYNTEMTDSITDLLFYSPAERLKKVMTKEFQEGYIMMKNKYTDRIRTIDVMLFHGNTREAFSNFIHAQRIDEIVTVKEYRFDHGASISPLHLIKGANVPVTQMSLGLAPRHPQKDMIAALLAY